MSTVRTVDFVAVVMWERKTGWSMISGGGCDDGLLRYFEWEPQLSRWLVEQNLDPAEIAEIHIEGNFRSGPKKLFFRVQRRHRDIEISGEIF